MASREDLADLIAESYAAKMAPSVVLRKLRAGTLDGLDGPVEISDSTFFRHWREAKRGVARQQQGESILAILGREIKAGDLIKAMQAQGSSAEEIVATIVERTGLSREHATATLPPDLLRELDVELGDLVEIRARARAERAGSSAAATSRMESQ